MNTKQAKDFLVQQTSEQAALENVSLSDLEKRMMYFTESDPRSCENPFDLNGEFEAQYDSGEYELKISRLLHQAYRRLEQEGPEKPPLTLADSFAGVASGNQSRNGTATEQQWYPPLASCYDASLNPPPSCPGPNEAVEDAITDLITRLQNPTVARLAQTQIFSKLGNDANGKQLTTSSFKSYLANSTPPNSTPHFYNALLSTYCYDALTSSTV
jgi:hypothetical protein